MKLDIAGVLRDAWARWKTDRAILIPVTGVFFFLPPFAQTLFIAGPAANGPQPKSLAAAAELFERWYLDHIVALLAGELWTLIGAAIVLCLYLRSAAADLRDAMAAGLRLLPGYVLLALIINVMIGAGLILFLLPGYYLVGRMILGGPIYVAERPGLLGAIERSFTITKGKGFVLAGLGVLAPVLAYLTIIPIQVIGEAFDRAPFANPVSAALIDAMAATVGALATLAGLLIRIAVYRRMAAPW